MIPKPALLALCVGAALFAQTEYGPENGTLVIVGGGNLTGTGIMETFLNRAGGPAAKIVVIPTAGGNKNAKGEWIVYKEDEIIAP
jgi:cyanophycinase